MDEIHAYRNDDGTYRVEITGKSISKKEVGHYSFEETYKTNIEVPRATVSIVALSRGVNGDDVLSKFTVLENGEMEKQ